MTPRGIFPLKRFFGGGMKVGDEDVAWEVMKQKLMEIIDQEDKSNPLSDEDLVEKMNAAGCPVKRRTITKYRQMAHIPSSRERRTGPRRGASRGRMTSRKRVSDGCRNPPSLTLPARRFPGTPFAR